MAQFAYDGASPFNLNDAKVHGAIAITGYIVGKPGGFDPINKARVDKARQLGMGFLPNRERKASFFLDSTMAEAKAAGVESIAACRALGVPDDGTVQCAFSFDTFTSADRFHEMGAKINQVKAGLAGHYICQIYGQSNLIEYLCANGYLTGQHWLMGSTFNMPYNIKSPHVCMVQSHDIDGKWLNTPVAGTDINTITDPHGLRAWWPDGSPYASTKEDITLDASTKTYLDKHFAAVDDHIKQYVPRAVLMVLTGQTNALYPADSMDGTGAEKGTLNDFSGFTTNPFGKVLAAQTATINALAEKTGLTGDQIKAIITEALNASVVDVNVTVHGDTGVNPV